MQRDEMPEWIPPHECEDKEARKQLGGLLWCASERTDLDSCGEFYMWDSEYGGTTLQFNFCPICGVQFEEKS